MLQTAQRTAKSKRKKRASASLGETAADKTAPPHERFLEAFRWMLLARTLEEKLVSLYRGGQITGGVYIGKGQEAVSVACGLFLEKGDIFAPLIRDQAGRSAFGEPLSRRHAHVPRLAPRPDARARRQYSSRASTR